MEQPQSQDPTFNPLLELRGSKGLTKLGLHTNQIYHDDPKRLAIMLSRYKFVSKMLSGKSQVLEIGCGDAFGTRIVLQEVETVLAIDTDPAFVEDVNSRMEDNWLFECEVHNILEGPVAKTFDAAYALDVLEHIPVSHENTFMGNVTQSLHEHGVLVLGIPSLQSQQYASVRSKAGHVNCKDAEGFRQLMMNFFHNTFIFSMNDEVVHTGFYPMAHYLIAVGTGRKAEK